MRLARLLYPVELSGVPAWMGPRIDAQRLRKSEKPRDARGDPKGVRLRNCGRDVGADFHDNGSASAAG
jgi:hypothetical protein